MLSLQSVSMEYDYRVVLQDINFTFQTGGTYRLTAPNGSGKSTLLRIMAGGTRPTSGRVLWDRQTVASKHRRLLGVMLQQPFLYSDMTGVENLLFYARLYGVASPRQTALQWMEEVGLDPAHDNRVKNYSKGMRQRLSLARAMIHQPKILLFDEPMDGLDRQGREIALRLMKHAVGEGAALFFITHDEGEADFCQSHYTLRYGRLVVDGG